MNLKKTIMCTDKSFIKVLQYSIKKSRIIHFDLMALSCHFILFIYIHYSKKCVQDIVFRIKKKGLEKKKKIHIWK